MEVLTNIRVDLGAETVLPRLRVSPEGPEAPEAERLLAQARETANPKGIYEVCYVGQKSTDAVELGGVVFTSRVLRVNLAEAHRVFPYIATCGVELDELEREVDGDPLRQYWLDEIRILALRAASAAVRERIEERYRPGEMSAMSPGSLEDWPISQQRELFSVFGDVEAKIGVRLTDSSLMVPLKSLSGVYFPTELRFESCRLCPRESCPGRRAPYDPHLWHERYAERPEGEAS